MPRSTRLVIIFKKQTKIVNKIWMHNIPTIHALVWQSKIAFSRLRFISPMENTNFRLQCCHCSATGANEVTWSSENTNFCSAINKPVLHVTKFLFSNPGEVPNLIFYSPFKSSLKDNKVESVTMVKGPFWPFIVLSKRTSANEQTFRLHNSGIIF